MGGAQCPSICPSVRPQNWAGMRCPYKLLRMVLALVCSEYGDGDGDGDEDPVPPMGAALQ